MTIHDFFLSIEKFSSFDEDYVLRFSEGDGKIFCIKNSNIRIDLDKKEITFDIKRI